jgi:hypothetical protein
MTDLLKLGCGLFALAWSLYVCVCVVPKEDWTAHPAWAEMSPLMRRWVSWRTMYVCALATFLGVTLTWEAILALLAC